MCVQASGRSSEKPHYNPPCSASLLPAPKSPRYLVVSASERHSPYRVWGAGKQPPLERSPLLSLRELWAAQNPQQLRPTANYRPITPLHTAVYTRSDN